MSFTQEIKSEISKNELHACCGKAQLAALLQFNGSLSLGQGFWQLLITQTNPTVSKRILMLLKERYQVETQLAMISQRRFKRSHLYYIRVRNDVKAMLYELELLDDKGLTDHPRKLLSKDCCTRAYLAGAFLSCGSVNSPNTANYHLELAVNQEHQAKFLMKLMHKYQLGAKIIKRRNQWCVYLKASEQISDFLRLIGAHGGVMKFEDVRIQRDFMNNLSRLDNCEVANEIKTQQMANRQFQQIRMIEETVGLNFLEPKLLVVAKLRLANPEASLVELCDLYENQEHETISKSGMRHRLNKLGDIANRLSHDG
jgi:cell division protein WhiA